MIEPENPYSFSVILGIFGIERFFAVRRVNAGEIAFQFPEKELLVLYGPIAKEDKVRMASCGSGGFFV